MMSYVQRWDKAYTLHKDLDGTYAMSKELRGDMVLERAGFADAQILLALISTEQSTNIDKLKSVLIRRHANEAADFLLPTFYR